MASLWRTTAFRLTLSLCALFLIAIVAMLSLVYGQTAGYLTRRVDRILAAEAAAIRAAAPEDLAARVTAAGGSGSLSAVGLFSADGRLIAGDDLVRPADLPADGAPHEIAPHDVGARQAAPAQRALLQVLPSGQILIVRRDASQLVAVRRIILRAVLWSGALIAAAGLAIAAPLSLRSLRRVREIQSRSRAIAAGDLAVRLPLDGSRDEVDQLAGMVNVMIDEVERLMAQAGSFGESAAHELRTPLTRLRATLDHAARAFPDDDPRQGLLERCVAETDSLLARFRALLRIAAVEARNRQAGVATADLSALVEQVGELYGPLAAARGIELAVAVAPGVVAPADAELMFEALSNLVDNALKFTPAGGAVRLSLRMTPAGPVAEVRDNGVGIPRTEWPLVTRRFYRGANGAGAPGHGLGLSLVAAVAALHGFAMSIGDAEPGAVVRITCWRA